MQGYAFLYHCLFPASICIYLLVVWLSLCLDGSHVVVRELIKAVWVRLIVYNNQVIKKGNCGCTRIIYMVLVVYFGKQEIHIERNSVIADVQEWFPEVMYVEGFGGAIMQGS